MRSVRCNDVHSVEQRISSRGALAGPRDAASGLVAAVGVTEPALFRRTSAVVVVDGAGPRHALRERCDVLRSAARRRHGLGHGDPFAAWRRALVDFHALAGAVVAAARRSAIAGT